MLRLVSKKKVKELSEIVKPFKISFPVDIELSVNKDFIKIPKNTETTLNEAEYQVIMHSQYAKYLQ